MTASTGYRISAIDESGLLLEWAYIWASAETAAESARDYFAARPKIATRTARIACTNLRTGLAIAMPESPVDEFVESIDDLDRLHAGLIPEPNRPQQ